MTTLVNQGAASNAFETAATVGLVGDVGFNI